MSVRALICVRTNVKSDCRCSNVYLYSILYHNVWIRGMEQRYGTDPSNRYGTGPGPCPGPYNLTCNDPGICGIGRWANPGAEWGELVMVIPCPV